MLIAATQERRDAAERAEWKRIGVEFEQLPDRLKVVMTAVAAVCHHVFVKSLKGIVFLDFAETQHSGRFTCDSCGRKLTGWAILYKQYSSRYDSVCLDTKTCFKLVQAQLDERQLARKPSHVEAMKAWDTAMEFEDTDETEKPSGKVEEEEESKGEEASATDACKEEGCSCTSCDCEAEADKKEEA